MATKSLTKAQAGILTIIRELMAEGYCPSLAEIGDAAGLTSLATVHKHLESLERKGHLTRERNLSRAIVLTGACQTCGHPKDHNPSSLS